MSETLLPSNPDSYLPGEDPADLLTQDAKAWLGSLASFEITPLGSASLELGTTTSERIGEGTP